MSKKRNLIDKLIRDKHGRIVLGQYPNIPILAWFLFWFLGKLPFPDTVSSGFEVISAGFLFAWAYLELVSGATYVRKALGLVVLAGLIIRAF